MAISLWNNRLNSNKLNLIEDCLLTADGKLAVIETDELWFYSKINKRFVCGELQEHPGVAHQFIVVFDPNPDYADYDSVLVCKSYSTCEFAKLAKEKSK